jgi:hypothetical protein
LDSQNSLTIYASNDPKMVNALGLIQWPSGKGYKRRSSGKRHWKPGGGGLQKRPASDDKTGYDASLAFPQHGHFSP